MEISGGEAQKIAIARALYKDVPFISLDEPTAALDPIAEAEIYEKFNEIAGDKTAGFDGVLDKSVRQIEDRQLFDAHRVAGSALLVSPQRAHLCRVAVANAGLPRGQQQVRDLDTA